MVATTVLVALLACQICVIDGYKLANTRMQISMASSNPFGSFMGGMNKPSSSSGGNDPPRWRALSSLWLCIMKRFKRSKRSKSLLKRNPSLDSLHISKLKLTYQTTFTARIALLCCDTFKALEYFNPSNYLIIMTLRNRPYVWPWLSPFHFILFHFWGGGKTVLITGATGLIGTELTKSLRSKNVTVRRLTTGSKKDENDFLWNPSSNSIGKNLLLIVTDQN